MQTNKAFNNISIDSANRKKASFHAPFDVNTTFGFGDVQPLQCKLCVPNSKVSYNMASIVRLAPMVAPTFTRMKYKTWTSFVGMSDLVKNFENFILKRPRSTGSAGTIVTSTSLPTIKLGVLSAYCLIGARVSVYQLSSSVNDPDSHYTAWNSYDSASSSGASAIATLTNSGAFRNIFRDPQTITEFNGAYLSSINMYHLGLRNNNGPFTTTYESWVPIQNTVSSAQTGGSYLGYNDLFNGTGLNLGDRISLESADYVINTTIDNFKLAFAFRLSEFGKRVRKVLLGCGYQIDFRSRDDVSLMPLAAVYKAYFDAFGLCLYTNYEVSPMNQFMTLWSSSNSASLSLTNLYGNSASTAGSVFAKAMVDLGNMFVTDSQDFISAHMESDAVGQKFVPGFVNNIVLSPNYDGQSNLEQNLGQESFDINQYYGSVKSTTNHVYIDRVNHSEVDAEVLKRLYKFTNRNTIAGQRLAQLLEAGGYGSYVKEQKSSFVGYAEVEINVDDVNCTSDSYNSAGDNTAVLGEYVGKGFGFDEEAAKKTFTYENDEFGYFITLAAIVPESGFTEGMDMTLFDIKPEDFYQPDFDGLGMEFTKKHVVKSTEDWTSVYSSDGDVPSESFGVVPRFSRYKVTKNVINGDFSLRGARAGYLPYTLDKVIQAGDRVVGQRTLLSNGAGEMIGVYKQPSLKQLPIAGDAWRYASRWPWLNSFGRIFTQYDFGRIPNDVSVTAAVVSYEFTHTGNDHFLVHNIVNFRMYAPMLPIADSYGTTDENNGRGDMTMTKA